MDYEKFFKEKWPYLVLVLILSFFFITQMSARNNKLSDAGDNALYIILGESLSKGWGYRELNQPGAPNHVGSPPLFPIMLAPLIFIFGVNIPILKIYMILLSVGALFAMFLFLKQVAGVKIALALTAIMSMAYEYIHWTQQIMPEVPFMIFVYLALYFLLKEKGWWAIMFTLFAIFTKPIGFVLYPTIILYLLFKKKYSQAFIMLIVIGTIFGLWTYRNTQYTSLNYVNSLVYIDPYNPEMGTLDLYNFAKRVGANTFVYIKEIAHLIFHYNFKINAKLFLLDAVFLVPLLFGFFKMIFEKRFLIPTFMLLFMGLIVVWPWQGIRFILPLLPVFLWLFIEGIREITYLVRDFIPIKISWVFYGLVALLLIVQVPSMVSKNSQNKNFEYMPELVKFNAMADWASKNMNKSDIVICRKPYLFYIWSGGVKTRLYPYSTDTELWMQYVVEADYLIYDEISNTADLYVKPIVEKFGFMFRPLFHLERTAIFKIHGDASLDENPYEEVVENG